MPTYYGVSIVLAVKALRVLGAARESAYFATAPFVGALLSIVVFRDLPNVSELAGATLMLIGVVILVRERHGHLHAHEAILREHLHVHDDHLGRASSAQPLSAISLIVGNAVPGGQALPHESRIA